MKKAIFLITFAVSSCLCFTALASHLAGQDFTYALIDATGGTYHYRVTLNLYEDCQNGDPAAILADNPAFLAVYTGAGTLVRKDSVSYSAAYSMPVTNGSCSSTSTPMPICITRKTFLIDYYLPASASGYTITYQRCCLNSTLVNIVDPDDQGISCSVSIPPSSVTTYNNSAVFTGLPP